MHSMSARSPMDEDEEAMAAAMAQEAGWDSVEGRELTAEELAEFQNWSWSEETGYDPGV